MWQVGFSRQVITPRTDVWLAGYGWQRKPTGTRHDLWMKVMAVSDETQTPAVLVATDHMGWHRSTADVITDQISQRYQVPRERILLTYSHNHCGPVLEDCLPDYYPPDAEHQALTAEYTQWFVHSTVEAVGKALTDMEPAAIRYTEGICRFAVNRRNNVESQLGDNIPTGLTGPVDHRVPILTAENHEGTLTGVLFGYACHPTTLCDTQWCGDYPGYAQLALEEGRPDLYAMFVAGCGADQNPLPRRTAERCRRYGHMLAAAVEEAIRQPMSSLTGPLHCVSTRIHLPFVEPPTEAQLRTWTNDDNAILSRWAQAMLQQRQTGVALQTGYDYPITLWRFGTALQIVALGGEAVVDYADILQAGQSIPTIVLGYAHELVAYIPTDRVQSEGGYEGGEYLHEYHHDARAWAPGVQQRIIDAAHALSNQCPTG